MKFLGLNLVQPWFFCLLKWLKKIVWILIVSKRNKCTTLVSIWNLEKRRAEDYKACSAWVSWGIYFLRIRLHHVFFISKEKEGGKRWVCNIYPTTYFALSFLGLQDTFLVVYVSESIDRNVVVAMHITLTLTTYEPVS